MDGFSKVTGSLGRKALGGSLNLGGKLAIGVREEIGRGIEEATEQAFGAVGGMKDAGVDEENLREEIKKRDVSRIQQLEAEMARIRKVREQAWQQRRQEMEQREQGESEKQDLVLPSSPKTGPRLAIPGRSKASDMGRVETRKPPSG